jgi:hypothetical protein
MPSQKRPEVSSYLSKTQVRYKKIARGARERKMFKFAWEID